MLNSNRLQYLLAKEVESAFEGNKNMLMRKTVKGDEGSPEGKRIRQFTERGFKERTDVNPPHSFFQILDKKKTICRCIKPNVFTDASSYTSCYAGHDNFTTS